MQSTAARYGLPIDGSWNRISIPHAGPHPTAYHLWLEQLVRTLDAEALGDVDVFLDLWKEYVVAVIESDPSIVFPEYWDC